MSDKQMLRSTASWIRQMKFMTKCQNQYQIHELNLEDYAAEMVFLGAWASHIQNGLVQHMFYPKVIQECIECMCRLLHVLAHYVDPRDIIVMMTKYMSPLLRVFGYYSTHPRFMVRNTICRAIVKNLKFMAGRMQNGEDCDIFNKKPTATRNDEIALYLTLCWDVENKAQFQLSADVRTHADDVFMAHLAQLIDEKSSWHKMVEDKAKIDQDHAEKLIDVQNLLLWLDAGMFFSRTPLDATHCGCVKCVAKRGPNYLYQ